MDDVDSLCDMFSPPPIITRNDIQYWSSSDKDDDSMDSFWDEYVGNDGKIARNESHNERNANNTILPSIVISTNSTNTNVSLFCDNKMCRNIC